MIPKVIHQTWMTKESNESIDKLRTTWMTMNPDFEYKYYDDNDIEKYIETHFSKRIQKSYARILNGSLKADFFRYCILYKEGGIYIDVDISCMKPILETIDFDNLNFITATDHCRIQRTDRIYQGFLGGEAKCELFMNMLLYICNCMETNQHKKNIFLLSGPIAFSNELKKYMNRDIENKEYHCIFLKELFFTNIHTKENFCIVLHDISKEILALQGVIFAKAQHRIDRKDNLHYFKNKSSYRKGYYI